MDVICAGLGRTGTSSLKIALETLGFGPCYHMQVLLEQPSHIHLWRRVVDGDADWPAILSGYRAVADEPAALYWRTLAELCPDARVVLNVRSAEDWYASVLATIHAAVQTRDRVDDIAAAGLLALVDELIFDGLFGGDFLDRDKALDIFRARNQTVVDSIDDDRLLIYDVAEGWGPLCDFLAVPVPDMPFPHVNTRDEFHEQRGLVADEGTQ